VNAPPLSAWITGASQGIGRELALQLARQGARVACSARSEEPLSAMQSAQPGIHPYPLDVSRAGEVAAAFHRIERNQGPLDLAVFNAGIYQPVPQGVADPELFQQHMTVNYQGVVNGVMAVLPAMRRRGRGQIAIVASVAGYRGLPRSAAYGPSKAALINLAETLYLENRDSGVRIRLINPGFVDTRLTAKNDFPMPAMMTAEQAAGRILAGLQGNSFEIAFPARFVFWLKLARLLPYRWYFPLIDRLTRS
jgi:NAD(P)-dependent dehydrogenase (short-subunit alcohol dehydrogenase family)